MKTFTKIISICIMVMLMLTLVACGNEQTTQTETTEATETKPRETSYVSIATASMGGSYYPIGVGMSELFQQNIENCNVTVEVTGGAAENPKLVGAGESDIGFTNANLAYAAYEGTGAFKDNAYSDLRLMFSGVAPGTIHLVVKESSDIYTYEDLIGKKVAVGPQGGGLLSLLPDLFGMYGFTMDDMECSYMSFDEGVQAVTDGNLDAAFVQAPHPSSAVQTMQGSGVGMRLIEIEDDIRDAFTEKYPYYNKVDIPASTYSTEADIKTVGTTNVVVINANLDEDLVYEMCKSIYENLEYLSTVHASAKSITLDSAVADFIPMHDGAVKYFTEVGAM